MAPRRGSHVAAVSRPVDRERAEDWTAHGRTGQQHYGPRGRLSQHQSAGARLAGWAVGSARPERPPTDGDRKERDGGPEQADAEIRRHVSCLRGRGVWSSWAERGAGRSIWPVASVASGRIDRCPREQRSGPRRGVAIQVPVAARAPREGRVRDWRQRQGWSSSAHSVARFHLRRWRPFGPMVSSSAWRSTRSGRAFALL